MIDFIASLFRLPPARPRPPLDTRLIGQRLMLRMMAVEDWKAWHGLRELSRDYLIPWEPEWPPQALTYGFFCSLLRRHWREWRSGKAYAFAIFLSGGAYPVFVGSITLSDIQRAAAQKGTLGYWIGKTYAGQGLMTEAVELVCDFAFDQLKLQRVEASCMLNNEASKTVLERTGFEQEGFAKAYLQINGKREDHILWGKMNPLLKKETAAIN